MTPAAVIFTSVSCRYGPTDGPIVVASTSWAGAFAIAAGARNVALIAPASVPHAPDYDPCSGVRGEQSAAGHGATAALVSSVQHWLATGDTLIGECFIVECLWMVDDWVHWAWARACDA